MNKKIIKISILILIIIVFIFSFFEFKAYKTINEIIQKKSKVELKNQIGLDKYKNFSIKNCNFGFLNNIYAFVSDSRRIDSDESDLEITFFKADRNNIFSSNWSIEYTGGTTIKNTTFPELVKMVKEDCSQFQQSKGDPNDKTINWSYSEYVPEPPKPQLTEEELAIQKELEEINKQKSIENRKNYKPIDFKIINE